MVKTRLQGRPPGSSAHPSLRRDHCLWALTLALILQLDALKTVQDGIAGVLPAYRGTVHAVKSIIREEGWRALYAGLSPALIGSGEHSICEHDTLA